MGEPGLSPAANRARVTKLVMPVFELASRSIQEPSSSCCSFRNRTPSPMARSTASLVTPAQAVSTPPSIARAAEMTAIRKRRRAAHGFMSPRITTIDPWTDWTPRMILTFVRRLWQADVIR